MKGKGWKSWPDVTDAQVRSRLSGLPQGTAVAVMTYASDLFSWYAGSLEADVYFCPSDTAPTSAASTSGDTGGGP